MQGKISSEIKHEIIYIIKTDYEGMSSRKISNALYTEYSIRVSHETICKLLKENNLKMFQREDSRITTPEQDIEIRTFIIILRNGKVMPLADITEAVNKHFKLNLGLGVVRRIMSRGNLDTSNRKLEYREGDQRFRYTPEFKKEIFPRIDELLKEYSSYEVAEMLTKEINVKLNHMTVRRIHQEYS